MTYPAPDGNAPNPLPGPQTRVAPGIPVVATLKEAINLLKRDPRTILLPLAVVTIPMAAAIASIHAALFLTAWEDRTLVTLANLSLDADADLLFAVVALAAAEALFTQVARAATIIAVAGVVQSRPPTLAEALDPAFTRLGGLLVLAGAFVAILAAAALTVVGLLVLPYVALRLALAFDTYMLEGIGPLQALRRSWDLMRDNMLRLLGLTLLAVLTAMPIIIVVSMFGAAASDDRATHLLLIGILSVIQSAAMVPVVGLLTACTTLYYLKARARYGSTDLA